MPKQKISVIGLGKLGAPLAVAFAAKGFRVVGLDIHKPFVDAINEGKAPVVEPKLQEYLDKGRKNISATQDYGEVIRESDITFLVVPTPSREDGHFSDEFLKNALAELGRELKASGKGYHTFVITSTVSPATCESSLIPLLEKTSGRKLTNGFGFAYNPEFIALGEVISGLLNPDLLLIGESDQKVGDLLEAIYRDTLDNWGKAYVARMSLVSAEIAKIAVNAYVTMKISYANTLASICEHIPGANVDDITRALGADKRISPHFLKAGPPFAGPCFPRDSRAFVAFANEYGVDATLARATDEINELQIKNLAEKVLEYLPQDKKVAILGLAYKPNTPVIEESPAIKLIEELLRRGIEVAAYDPLAVEHTKAVFGDKISYLSSAKEAFSAASCVVVTTRDKEFLELQEKDIIHNPTTVIDCWRMLEDFKSSLKVRYVGLGQHNEV